MTSPARIGATATSFGRTAVALRDKMTPEQVQLLKNTVAKGASDDEFALFLHNCERTGLDPFAKQIYCLKRRAKDEETQQWVDAMVTQVGIDGQRLVAERTGLYRGQTVPLFYDVAGNEREVWLDTKKPPVACKVGVYKQGFAQPLYAIALYEEYVQRKKDGNPTKQWREKPTIMLAKCAEALALRKAFPQELSGIYVTEEMPDPEAADEPSTPIPAQHTRTRLAAPEQTATITADGHIQLTFGEHKGKKLVDVPTSWLLVNFRDSWKDAKRKELATQRLGAGFVGSVYAELERRRIPDEMNARIALLFERRAAGEILTDDDAEDLRQWGEDHPDPASAAPEGEAP